MKLFKIFIFVATILIGLCASDFTYAIRVDFLKNSPSLQPPTNISGGINSNVNQNQSGQNLPNYNFSPAREPSDFNKVDLKNNDLLSKNITHEHNFLWWIIFSIIIIFVLIVVLYVMDKRQSEDKTD